MYMIAFLPKKSTHFRPVFTTSPFETHPFLSKTPLPFYSRSGFMKILQW